MDTLKEPRLRSSGVPAGLSLVVKQTGEGEYACLLEDASCSIVVCRGVSPAGYEDCCDFAATLSTVLGVDWWNHSTA